MDLAARADEPLWSTGPRSALPGVRGLTALPGLRVLTALPGLQPDGGWEARWLLAVGLGAAGAYREAAGLLAPLAASSAVVPPAARSLALSTLASHARQTGRPEFAARADARAWALVADRTDGAAGLLARADASAGLVADAVAVGDAPLAARRLSLASGCAWAARPAWRPQVRLGWVAAELALARDRPGEARSHADQALARALSAGARRHVAKSRLLRGVAAATIGEAASAIRDLDLAVAEATALGLPTLIWPAALVLSRLRMDPADAARDLTRAVAAARVVHQGLGPGTPEAAAFAADPGAAPLLTRPAAG